MRNIDFVNYVKQPRIGATSGLILSVRILRAVEPLLLPAQVMPPLSMVHAAAERLQAAVRGRLRRSKGSRAEDLIFDAAWAGLHGRIQVWTRMVHRPEAAKARALLDDLFPTGLAWLQASHEEEWVRSRALRERIEDEGHAALIIELAGEIWLKMVEEAHVNLGEALGLDGEVSDEAPTLLVGEEVRALAEAIATYGRIFAGTVIDDASLAVFELAMQPLDAHRERQRRAGTSASPNDEGDASELAEGDELDDDIDIDEPLPPLPDSE